MDHVHFIAYNSITTGSVETRSYNLNVLFPELKKRKETLNNLSRIGEYAFLYDDMSGGGKANEPNYDGLMSLILCTKATEFNKTLVYKKILLTATSGTWGRGHFANDHPDTMKFCMIPDAFNRTKEYSRGELFEGDYFSSEYKHVVIMSPLDEDSYTELLHIIKQTKVDRHKLVIHYQGESNLGYSGIHGIKMHDKDFCTEYFGMTPKGGLFPNSFNWTGGMLYGKPFRELLEKCPNCYTICVKDNNTDIDFVSTEIMDTLRCFEGGVICKKNLPKLFEDMNNYILFQIYSQSQTTMNTLNELEFIKMFNDKLGQFDNITVIEDMYDKDNSTAIEILSQNTECNVKLYLVGKVFFKTLYNSIETTVQNRRVIEMASGKNTDKSSEKFGELLPNNEKAVPANIKPTDYPTGMFFTLLDFTGGSTDSYWPVFNTNDLTCYNNCIQFVYNAIQMLYKCYQMVYKCHKMI